jgi:hypothetical protein
VDNHFEEDDAFRACVNGQKRSRSMTQAKNIHAQNDEKFRRACANGHLLLAF